MISWILFAALYLATLISSIEYVKTLKLSWRMLPGMVTCAFAIAAFVDTPDIAPWLATVVSVALLWLGIIIIRFHDKYTIRDVALTYFAFVYIAFPLIFVYLISKNEGMNFHVLLIFVIAWVSDVSSLLLSKKIGRRKVSGLCSKTTCAGAAAGAIITVVIVISLAVLWSRNTLYWQEALVFGGIAFVGAFFAFIGRIFLAYLLKQAEMSEVATVLPHKISILRVFTPVFFVAAFIYVWHLNFPSI
ncbi:MAG: phosphatidate cytidylyltransferase [Defluviitaleaceae bacterium]|nr:phosphatidate cytidylyltransferase [Defluviitaleaceae bacterium]